MDVSELAAIRKGAFVSWMAIVMKAYSLVAQRHAELRRAYIPFPWPHLYEHSVIECGLLLERDHEGENIVIGTKLRAPEHRGLAEIESKVKDFREAPLHEIGHFRQ